MARPKGPPTRRSPSRLPEALLDAVEAWRVRQPRPPSTTAALAYLIGRGLETADNPSPPRRRGN